MLAQPGPAALRAQPLLNRELGWAVCNYKRLSSKDLGTLRRVHNNPQLQISYIVDVLTADNRVVSARLHRIQSLSGLRLNMDAFRNLSGKEERAQLALMLKECVRRNADNLLELHPVKRLNINDEQLKALCRKMDALKAKVQLHKGHHLKGQDVDALVLRYKEKQAWSWRCATR